MRLSRGLTASMLFVVIACGGDDAPPNERDGGNDAGRDSGCIGANCCATDSECDDGLYCNGTEICTAEGCTTGTTVICNDSITCTTDACDEATDQCVFTAPDVDNDDHDDASCVDANGDPLGDDCDDNDATRFPGNPELCVPTEPNATADEDCNPLTFGDKDDDGDGSIDDVCCNTDDNNDTRCGLDCDDTEIAKHRRQPEFCDGLDNDCDTNIDEVQNAVDWYMDADMDGFGVATNPILSCTPQAGRSLVATDCDDTDDNIKPTADESCDTTDNNCNGVIDELLINCGTTPINTDPLPINECLNVNDCNEFATCTDEVNGFGCACMLGYNGSGVGPSLKIDHFFASIAPRG